MSGPLKVASQRLDPFEDPAPSAQVGVPEIERELERDRWGRPMLFPAGGPRVRTPYTRMSSLADYITDQRAVTIWQDRYLARILAQPEQFDLRALLASETYNTGFGMADAGENRASGRRIDAIIHRALDRANIHERADYGTAVHLLTEPGNQGRPVDEKMAADVASWEEATRGIEILATELFVANDELMAAGTFDHMVRVPGIEGAVILDKKTGKMHPEQFGVQLSGYANADLYEPGSDERNRLEETFGPINREIAIVAMIPAREGRTLLYPVNIAKGYEAAKVAVWVRNYQNSGAELLGAALNPARLAYQRAAQLIEGCTTAEELNELWSTFRAVWDDDLTARGKALLAAAASPMAIEA